MNNYKINKLKNDFEYIKIFLPYYKTCSIVVYVKVGSKHENKNNNGVAHFLEHVNFKGSLNYSNANIISKELDSIGCIFNAYTNKNMTVYHFKFAYKSEYFNKILSIVSDILFYSYHRNEDIEAERMVIYEEIKNTLDDPDESIDDLVAEMMFKDSPLGLHTLGSLKTIKSISRNTIHNFYKKYYVPNNMIMSICGKIPNNIDSLVEKYFENVPGSKSLQHHNIVFNKFENVKPELKIIKRSKMNQCYINIAFPAYSLYDSNLKALKLLSIHLGGNMSSILFNELREKRSLVYDVSTDVYAFEEGGYFSIYTSTDPKNTDKVIKIILEQLVYVHNSDFKNLEILKVNEIHSKEILWEDCYNVAEYYADQLLLFDKVTNTSEFINNIKKVTNKNIMTTAKNIINFSKMKVIVIGNISKKDINLSKIIQTIE
jgi:predicted Zn-dependent peptidase